MTTKTLEERFWAKVDKRGANDCWPWCGATTKDGYGQISTEGKRVLAHRVSWELHAGRPVPGDKLACHTCSDRTCVNPEHIWLGTAAESRRDTLAKRSTCPRGHQQTNPIEGPVGRCPICHRERNKKYRLKLKTGNSP